MHGKKDDDGIDGRFLVYFSIEIVTIILQLSVLRVQLCISGWLLWLICFACFTSLTLSCTQITQPLTFKCKERKVVGKGLDNTNCS